MNRVRVKISDYLLNPLNKRVILIVTVTVIATELFIVTDIGPFRFSIGTVVFIYAIFTIHHLLIIPTAIMVALSTLLLRVGLDYFLWLPRDYFTLMMSHHYAGVVYFLLLSLIIKISGIRKRFRGFTASVIIFTGLAVALSNLVEALVRVPLQEVFSLPNMLVLLLMSAVQVFLVSSLVTISQFQKAMVLNEQERVNYEKMLIVASELYDELFYMQKSVENIENIMAKSYHLHKRLKELKHADHSLENTALDISEEVHEVKKDTVRIVAGLGELLKIREDKPIMNLAEIIDLVIKTNRSYSHSLDKRIHFNMLIEKDLEVEQIYPLLSLLNNLVSNAVEAISKEGYIHLKIRSRGAVLIIQVCDSGDPIKKRDRMLIFEPGYTTKFSSEGVPSTGIGLTYVKSLVEQFRGRVLFQENKFEKCFTVLIPISSLARS